MASALTDKLSLLVKQISGQARITESNVADMLREVRMALLEADVALPVVRDFVARNLAEAENDGFEVVDDWGGGGRRADYKRPLQKDSGTRGRETISHGHR